jgi:hypothetical protein
VQNKQKPNTVYASCGYQNSLEVLNSLKKVAKMDKKVVLKAFTAAYTQRYGLLQKDNRFEILNKL